MFSHYLPHAFKVFESANNPYNPLHYMNSAIDMMFYDISMLSAAEFNQAVWAPLPEGSIMILRPGKAEKGYGVCRPQQTGLTGIERAKAVVDQYEHYLETHHLAIDTIAVGGLGSSTVGAAAFGKEVAEILQKPVASVVVGRGAVDIWGEILGGMTLGGVSHFVHALDPLIHTELHRAGVRTWVRQEIEDSLKAVPEALTLRTLMVRNIFEEKDPEEVLKLTCRPKDRCSLKTVVSHSKGDWMVWGALLGIEFLANKLPKEQITFQPKTERPHIDVVTFGCCVDLPHMPGLGELRKIFHYHQFVGLSDVLLGLTQSPYQKSFELLAKGLINGFGAQHATDPDEALVPFKGHGLFTMSPLHMPMEDILKECVVYPHAQAAGRTSASF